MQTCVYSQNSFKVYPKFHFEAMQLYDQIQETVQYLQARCAIQVRFGIILGTGLSKLKEDIDIQVEIPYEDIPHFPVSTVASHQGKLIFGYLGGQAVIAMAGRFHYYEGYSMQQVTFPVRVMRFLGIERLIISNAAGSTNADMLPGDMVFVRDHINLQPENPLRGPNDERIGLRFPDLLKTYDRSLNALALEIAAVQGARAHEGVYVGLQGPNLETPAEYEYLHRIGGDVVGMSTVPEVLVARHMGLPIFVVSVVSNLCYPIEAIGETTLEEVIAVVEAAEPKIRGLVVELIKAIS